MTALKWFTMAFVALNIAACAFDKNSNSDTQQELDDRAALYEKYNRVTGTYSGTIVASTIVQPVDISFFTIEKKKGETADGQPKYLPVLMARYRVKNTTDLEQMDAFMEAKYITETSEIFMSNAEGSLGVHGTISGEDLTADVTRNGGRWGALRANLTSRAAAGENNANVRAERDARLTKLYEPITGFYKGTVTLQANSSGPSFNAELLVSIGQVKDKDGYFMPALQAYFTPKPPPIPGKPSTPVDSLAMNGEYRSDASPPYIAFASYEGRADSITNLSGSVQTIQLNEKTFKQVFTGAYSNRRGQAGTFSFEKQRP